LTNELHEMPSYSSGSWTWSR